MPDLSSRRSLPIQGRLLPAGQRPRCRGCENELRPNFTYADDLRVLTGYGVWDRGLFCSKTCATRYAHQITRSAE
jgi:hypothetical protein